MSSRIGRLRTVLILGVGIALTALGVLAYATDALEDLERDTVDTRFAIRDEDPALLLGLREDHLPHRGDGFCRLSLQNHLPTPSRARVHVLLPVVEIQNIRAAFTGHFFQRFVNLRIRLHRADFVGKNVTVKIGKKGKFFPDVKDGQIVGVGKNISRDAALA